MGAKFLLKEVDPFLPTVGAIVLSLAGRLAQAIVSKTVWLPKHTVLHFVVSLKVTTITRLHMRAMCF